MPASITRARGFTAPLFLALGAVVLVAALWVIGAASGADHRDSPAAEANSALDITDVYAFRSPSNNDNLVVAFGVNGLTAPEQNSAARFNANGTYTVHVDTDGDLEANAAVTVDFDDATPQRFSISGLGDSPLTGEITAPGGPLKFAEAGGIKAFAGLRDDPFFFDLVAFKTFVAGPYVPAAGLRAADDGSPADTFAGTNASYVVLELPITALTGEAASNSGTIKAWVSTATGSGQLDRMAIPAINTALIPTDKKDAFNRGAPATDEAQFRQIAQDTMQGLRDAVDAVLDGPVGAQDGGPLGNLTSEEVAAALIPDIVTVDFSEPVAFPNGRQLTDDVIDVALQLVLNRTAGVTDAVDGNDKNFASSFPYLADPHVAAGAPTAGALPETGGNPGGTGVGVASWMLFGVAAMGALLMLIGAGAIWSRRPVS